jgi:ribonuclease E
MPEQDMLINYVSGEECRIAIVEDGKLEELYTERASDDIHVGNIYRGKVTNVEPSIQAAFVDFGLERNGFLHISDLHPQYFGQGDDTERVGKRTPRKDRPPIQQCLKRGQRILVQVLKEGIGSKGPTLTSYLSIPGRFLVMMPDMERHGVSRKVEDEDQRREMRKILDELNPPEEFGFIVRTAGIGRTKTEIKRDLAYLQRLWKAIEKRQKQGKGPVELYRESDLVIRTLRDVLSNDVKRIIIDDEEAAQRARDFIRIALPRGGSQVIYYDKPVPLFDAFGIEQQIDNIHSREVPLPSGGSLVIESTEALVAVDVNSGKFRDKGDAESTAYATNQEAVDEISRQLRLRDLGGVVVLDLIDMYQNKHRRDIERRFKENLKKDRARTKPLKINELGLLSLTRQRMRPSLKRSLHKICPTCDGHGTIRTAESVALDVMRKLAVVLSDKKVQRAELSIHPDVGAMLLNRKRRALHKLEEQLGKSVEIKIEPEIGQDEISLKAFDDRDVMVDLDKLSKLKPPKFTDNDIVDAGAKFDDAGMDADEDDVSPQDSSSNSDSDEDESSDDDGNGEKPKKRRRRRRGGRRNRKKSGDDDTPSEDSSSDNQKDQDAKDKDKGRGNKDDDEVDGKIKVYQPKSDDKAESAEGDSSGDGDDDGNGEKPKKRRRRRRGGRRHRQRKENAEANSDDGGKDGGDAKPEAEAAGS